MVNAGHPTVFPACTPHSIDGENFDSAVGQSITVDLTVPTSTKWEVYITEFPVPLSS